MKATNTTKSTTYGFRAVFRGKNSSGEYKRAVRTVQASDFTNAANIVSTDGENMVKGCGFKVDYVTILPPLTSVK